MTIRFAKCDYAVLSDAKALSQGADLTGLAVNNDDTCPFAQYDGTDGAYHLSVDFSDPVKPVPRCSCPSKKSPCKHTVTLLYAHLAIEK
ncbi:MAG: SWIM zinc finger family protein [Treponema sp.]|nr:SWIM zinc finger family protein [Treponema sp.]